MSMRFDIITIFPESIEPYFQSSMLRAAQIKKLISVYLHNLRAWGLGVHKKVDDRPYAGGPGMVFKLEPLIKALASLKLKETLTLRGRGSDHKRRRKPLIILFSPAGKQLTSHMAKDFAKKEKHIVMIAGHYEGIDERIKNIIRDMRLRCQEISVGPYVLTGGELPAAILVDAVSRYIPGVLGKADSLEEKRFGVGVPSYTRPEVFTYKKKAYRVPKVLLSGNHKAMAEWKKFKLAKRKYL